MSTDDLEPISPQAGPQTALLECPCDEILFGGARGAGKTYAALLKILQHITLWGQYSSVLVVRRTYKQLDDMIKEAKRLFTPHGAQWHGAGEKFIFPNKAEAKFRHLDGPDDADEYLGHQYTLIVVEEITTFPSPEPIEKLKATLRSAHGIKCQFVATGNPGGPGHQWVKSYFVDPCVTGNKVIGWTTPEGVFKSKIFIKGTVHQNKKLNAQEYISQLRSINNPQLMDAWIFGKWDLVIGAFFPEFDVNSHVLRPFPIPRHWMRFRAADWGSSSPFCVGWYAVATDYHFIRQDERRIMIPRGAVVQYREWYGCQEGRYNEGLRLTVEEVAHGIRFREREDCYGGKSLVKYGEIDPSCDQNIGGPTHIERFGRAGVQWTPAKNQRTNRDGRIGGWDMVRQRLKGEEGRPMLYFFDTCNAIIRTLPAMQNSPTNYEDLDTESEDHAVDCLRYGMMSRPWIAKGTSLPVMDNEPHAIADQEGLAFPSMRVNLEPLFRDEDRQSRHVRLSHRRI